MRDSQGVYGYSPGRNIIKSLWTYAKAGEKTYLDININMPEKKLYKHARKKLYKHARKKPEEVCVSTLISRSERTARATGVVCRVAFRDRYVVGIWRRPPAAGYLDDPLFLLVPTIQRRLPQFLSGGHEQSC
jgi:hypothetical protein